MKLRAYMCATLFGIPVDATGWLWLSEDPAIAASYGAITIFLIGNVFFLLFARLPLPVMERIAFTAVAGLFLGRMAVVAFLTPGMGTEFGELLTSLIILCCVYLLAFLMFRRKIALAVSASVVLCSGLLLIGGLVLAGPHDLPHNGMPLLKSFTMQPVLVSLLYVLAVTMERMSAAQAREDVLEQLSTTDDLTGLPNRRYLTETLDREVAKASRSGAPLSVVLIDVDRFKRINDTHGHNVGDRVLRHLAETLNAQIRANDVFGRWGGEEFLLIAAGGDLEDAQHVARRYRERLHESPSPDVGLVTASFGVAGLAGSQGAESLIHAADQALYAAKERGRDGVVVHQEAPAPAAVLDRGR